MDRRMGGRNGGGDGSCMEPSGSRWCWLCESLILDFTKKIEGRVGTCMERDWFTKEAVEFGLTRIRCV